jgi:aldehyde dehydrogenase (NAD+)
VAPAATLARVEIFGPVLISMPFHTPAEAVALANDTRYGLAASVWTENINLALDVAPKLACGVVWINSTNLFDAAAGFGGVRESGFGREGGREGMHEYLRPVWEATLPAIGGSAAPSPKTAIPGLGRALDRTAKQYIGGRQVRPDSGYSRPVLAPDGAPIAEVGEGNAKDIRDAVEAAAGAAGWSRTGAHARAQILYFVAENLEARAGEFRDRLSAMTGVSKRAAAKEVAASVARLMSYAAWADKFDGAVHTPLAGHVILAMNEPVGVIGVACPDQAPLLAFVSLVAPAVAMGNRAVAVPSERHPLSATDFYQVLDTSDVPGGAINIITGARDVLARVMAEHDGVDAVWYAGPGPGSATVERAAAGNLKRTWVNHGRGRDWVSSIQGEGPEFLRAATEVKNIWVPYGE